MFEAVMPQTGLVAAPAGPTARASPRATAPTAATAARPALARVVRGRHPRTRWRLAGALASAEPESAVSDVEFALVGMTAPGDFLLIFFVFHLPVSRNLRPCSRELQPVLMEGFSPIRLLPVLRLAGHYGLSRRAWPGGPAQGGLGEKSLAPDGPR